MKSSDPEASLRKGSLPLGNGGLKAEGLTQGPPQPKSGAHSDEETLGDAPTPSKVEDVKFDPACLTSARAKYIEESGNHK